MSTNVDWQFVKDPRDEGWFEIPLAFTAIDLASEDVTITESGPIDYTALGRWPTAGDDPTGKLPLAARDAQLSDDGKSVKMWLSHGKPQTNYAIGVGVMLDDGSTMYVSAILPVSGR